MQKCFKKMLSFHSIRTQYMFFFLILLIPLTIAISLISYNMAAKIITNKTTQQANETVQQLSNSLDNYLTLMTNKVEILGNSPTVQEELNAPENEVNIFEDSFYSRSKQIRRLMLQEFSSVNMESMEISGLNGAEYYISINNDSSTYNQDELNSLAIESKGGWTLYNKNGELQLTKLIKDLQTYQPLGYVRISLKRSYIEKTTSSLQFGGGGNVAVLDENGHLLCGEMSDALQQTFNNESSSSGSFNFNDENKLCMVTYVSSSYSKWTTIGLIPYDYIYRDLKNYKYAIIAITIVFSLLAFGISSLLSKSIVAPIEDTAKALTKFSKGNFDVRLSEDRFDEIGQMNIVFNKTIIDIQTLMQRVSQADILAHEMEYKTLQSQMNPHFLYNTLDIINWMAFKKGETAICNMVTAVSNLMRISISNKQAIISPEQEIGYVKDYLYIQHVRYGDRFEAIYDIDKDLLTQMIPKLIVQPIVENSIVHGIESSNSKNIIRVSARKTDKKNISITVEDTGVGMSEEKVRSLLNDNNEDQNNENKYHTNLGIYAVNKRIEFLYGQEYHLAITSKENEGTKVIIHLPYMENPDELFKRYRSLLGANND